MENVFRVLCCARVTFLGTRLLIVRGGSLLCSQGKQLHPTGHKGEWCHRHFGARGRGGGQNEETRLVLWGVDPRSTSP
jgi:hypothetical protein